MLSILNLVCLIIDTLYGPMVDRKMLVEASVSWAEIENPFSPYKMSVPSLRIC